MGAKGYAIIQNNQGVLFLKNGTGMFSLPKELPEKYELAKTALIKKLRAYGLETLMHK